MSTSGHVATPSRVSGPELLLAVNEVSGIDSGFRDAVNHVERLLVESGFWTGLVVLEKRGAAIFPLAASGGPIKRATPQTVLSRPVNAGNRNIHLVSLADVVSSRRSRVALSFVTELIGKLLVRVAVFQQCDNNSVWLRSRG